MLPTSWVSWPLGQGVQAVAPEWLRLQAQVVIEAIPVAAVKIGIIGSLANALVLVDLIAALRTRQPDLPVVLDPVLASGHGDVLTQGDAVLALAPLRGLATRVREH